MRVAIYARVSTSDQTTDNQVRELQAWATRAGHTVVSILQDSGISGAKGRDKRPAFNAVLKAAVRREIDMIAVWSTDRLGRSMPHLIEVLQTLQATGVGLYIHTQALDTSTPAGRALFQMIGVFSELERKMIVARVRSGIARAKAQGTKSGKPIGRPSLPHKVRDAARDALLSGATVRAACRASGASVGSVGQIRQQLIASGQIAAV
jgi:DNA invertase Pin-like site-specific DNA recombinase